MTRQEIFTKVYSHLMQQMERCTSELAGGCAYRGEGGKSCAIGCLIPDDLYDPTIEGLGVTAFIEIDPNDDDGRVATLKKIKKFLGLRVSDAVFLRRLQSVHDDVDPIDWKDALSALASTFNLKIPTENG